MGDEACARDSASGEERAPAWAFVFRAAYVLAILSFLLPFATVKSCSTKEVKEYTGVGLMREEGGGVLSIVLCIALVLLALSFVRRRRTHAGRGLTHAARALVGGFALLFLPIIVGLQHLFSETRMHMGMYICSACWLTVYGLSSWLALAEGRRMRAQVGRPTPSRRVTALWLGAGASAGIVLLMVAEAAEAAADPSTTLAVCVDIGVVTLLIALPLGALVYFAVMATGVRTALPQAAPPSSR